MAKKVAEKRFKGAKRVIDPQKALQRKQKASTRALFARIGFERIRSDGIEFTFKGRTGEFDDIFIQENVLVNVEYTIGRKSSGHFTSKAVLYDKIRGARADWIEQYSHVNEEFAARTAESSYGADEFQIFFVYVSREGVGEEIEDAYPHYRFLDGTRSRYFEALGKTINRSARHEFFNYLNVDLRRLGKRVKSSGEQFKSFSGYILPELHSGYPKGFKVVSFYADPATLLEMSYVLRRDSWRDDEGLYQRILIKSKIRKMRQYLTMQKRVFVNNIIVTLPKAIINDPKTNTNVDVTQITTVTPVSVSMPLEPNMIGLVDGQHRVFSYHEAPNDALDAPISKQRERQNLLVTGLIFPTSWSVDEKRDFEARLFLEINDTQARAKTVLKHSIEVVLNPFSTVAIAKEVTNRLSKKGALNGLLQTNFFDPPEKIKTSSIVSYGLGPLVKKDGKDSLFAAWPHAAKHLLSDKSADKEERRYLLRLYIEFCTQEINELLSGARAALGAEKWKVSTSKDRQLLSPTTINGLFVCLRLLIEHNKKRGPAVYASSLRKLSGVKFEKYKSSTWNALGKEIFSVCFS